MKKLLALFTLFLSLSLFCGNAQAQNNTQIIDVGKIKVGETFTFYFNNSGETHRGTSITLQFENQNGRAVTYRLMEGEPTPGAKQLIGEVASTTTHYKIWGEITGYNF